jgi:ribosomal protein S18 acetylase RimI-like enzyme
MDNPISIAEIQANPRCISASIQAASGLTMTFRPLEPQDNHILGQYFLGLSENTISLYGPHPFDQATADHLCATINYADTIRMIATIPAGSQEQVIAYFILQLSVFEGEIQRYAQAGITIDSQVDCLIAPSVADAFQSQGLGTPLMRYMFQVARRMGRKHMLLMGGVYEHNARAVHYYQKVGFKTVGTFVASWAKGRPSYDMYVDL